MKRSYIFTAALLLFSSITFSQTLRQKCSIVGEVNDSTVSYILLRKEGQDLLRDDVLRIPVEEGRFHYTTTVDYPEAVTMYTNHILDRGFGKYSVFFLEPGEINITVFVEAQFDENTVDGGVLNQEYQKLRRGGGCAMKRK